ncbi:MAG: agmatine deiminase family protein [Candidatus Eisenbacteria bacterium]|nr:agmatine deiminase family protein [Candidatus Eisenbacteria bacterium]
MTLRTATLLVCLALVAGLCPAAPADQTPPEKSVAETLEGERYLPIGLTPEEEGMLHLIGRDHRRTAPPPGPARNPGEFEPMTGVIVRYPWGNPLSLLVEYAEDVTLWVIVANSSQQTSAYNDLQNAGCNMAHVGFITASTNSIWTRDYGPWFIVNGNNQQGIVDHVYNRPRPLDDVIPATIGTAWGIPVYGMSLTHTGGNYMSDGRGIAMSSRLVIDENPSLTPAQIDATMESYLGITQYEKLPYIQTSGIHHIDCWAKLLSPGTILIRSVPSTHTDYARIEANVAYISTLTSSWGRPYEIVRVYTPNNEPYTNSLILNDKVFVPLYGTAWDAAAIATYQAAMPGYEVLGFTGSWLSDDAIHCRAMGVTDRYMLYIDHVPLFDTADSENGYRVRALVDDMIGAGLIADSVRVHWKTSSAPAWTPVVMTAIAGTDSFYADIPAQNVGTDVFYYVSAADNSGRRERHPYMGAADPHDFSVLVDTQAPVIAHTPMPAQLASTWPPTASATVTDDIAVAAVTLESWINGARQPDAAMARVPGTFRYECAFPGSAGAGDAVNYRIVARDAATPPHETVSPAAGTHYFGVVSAVDVVIWEPDPSPLSGAAIGAVLSELGLSYEYTTTMPSNLAAYRAAFICLGIYSQNYALSTSQANAIVSYLNGGGNVYMEGGDCWAYDSARTIYNGHFGINGTSDGTADLSTVLGQAGTFTAGMSFSYTGGNSYIDHIAPVGSAFAVFRNPADNQGCGIANPAASYKTVGCSFEFGGLVNGAPPSTRKALLEEILGFFGIGTTGVPAGTAPRLALRQNSPNPFNPVTTLAFELPTAGPVELSVYSGSGRKVATLVDRALPAGPHAISWGGTDDEGAQVASGVYFFRLTQGGETVSVKGVLLK